MPPNHLFWFLMTATTGVIGGPLLVILHLAGVPVIGLIYTAIGNFSLVAVFGYLYARPVKVYT